MTIGACIKELREKKGISQKKLGNESGFTDQAIYYWETGRREIKFDNAVKVLHALGYRIEIVKEIDDEAD